MKFSVAPFVVVLCGCSPAGTRLAPMPEPAIVAESASVVVVAPGVKHRSYWIARGPWAVNVLDVDRSACWTPVALKAGGRAIGREKTSVLVSAFGDSARVQHRPVVAGGVNADFFAFNPPGVPVGAHVQNGLLITGPVDRPVLAIDSMGRATLGALALVADAVHGDDRVSLFWNHPNTNRPSLVDRWWGEATDSASGAVEVILRIIPHIAEAPPPGHDIGVRRMAGVVVAVDGVVAGVPVPRDGFLLTARARSDSAARAMLARLAPGDTVLITWHFDEFTPLEAVGGFPMLLRSGAIAPEVATAGSQGFRDRNPRTAVGIGAGGRRMLFVTVDGRQPGYSAGMSLAELAELMQGLGATDALNLDGGGSTTFVVADTAAENGFRIANRPSDKEGERPVANAIAVQQICGDQRNRIQR